MNQSNFTLLDQPHEKSLISFFNNNRQRNESNMLQKEHSHVASQNQLQMALINIKFKIEQKSSGHVKVNEEMHASLHGVNYTKKALFKAEYVKLFWMTYVKGFAPLLIEKMKVPNLTSDAGWGCVIRSAQMLVANALQKVYIHPNLTDQMSIKLKAAILNLFNDDIRQEERCAFSIQNICELGLVDHDHLPGEWYGV